MGTQKLVPFFSAEIENWEERILKEEGSLRMDGKIKGWVGF